MKSEKTCCMVMIGVALLFAAVDNNPKNAGNTMGLNAIGSSCDALYNNPALLGVERAPKGGIVIPGLNAGIGYWSDKLHVKPYEAFFGKNADSAQIWADINSAILMESFDLEGKSPEQVSDILTEEFEDGVTFYSGFRTSLLSFAHNHFGFDVTTRFDEQIHIPKGPLYAAFSWDNALVPGNTLDFGSLSQYGVWATDFTLQLGLPVNIPILHDVFKMRYGAGGVGVKYVMGHSILRAEASDDSRVTYNSATNSLSVSGEMLVQMAGTGFHGPWRWDNFSFPVTGHGIGVDIGGILYDNNAALSINISNLGVLFWVSDVHEVTYKIEKNDLDVYDILNAANAYDDGDSVLLTIFNRNENEYISDSRDTLREANGFATMLPLTLDIGYARTWNFEAKRRQALRYLCQDITVAVNYKQGLSYEPGQSFVPRLSLGAQFGALTGRFPIRMGMILGGPERYASVLGASVNLKRHSYHVAYKAIGNVFFQPKHGFEIAAAVTFNWGMTIDSDKDGIPDRDDKCPFKPEDFDGFEDEDGCPDYDNDQDGIPDSLDQCPNEPEDRDGFEDEDGCPDYDNDQDGIPDSLDRCPDHPEDRDNFQDDDGCPDYDNDGDGIPDSLDKCPLAPEDIDGFEDDDGCPDYDNDKDGIPDTLDMCMFEPEVYNGYKDDDGCPDTLQKPTEKETRELYTQLQSINFKTGSAELTSNSFTSLNFIAAFLKQYPHLRYEIQGHTDSQGQDEYNILLSAARASSVRDYLIHQGVPDGRILSIGYGKSRPIADNKTARGRAQNRRVEFKIIDTNEEYEMLNRQEAIFRQRIIEAKIKGVGKRF